MLKGYQSKIKGELSRFCNDIINLIDSQLLQKATEPEARVFYLKMKGDYYRYISEFTSGEENTKAGDNAQQSYKDASELAEKELSTTHPIRLGLALNYSVFFY